MIVYQVKREPTNLHLTDDQWNRLCRCVLGELSDVLTIQEEDMNYIEQEFSSQDEASIVFDIQALLGKNYGIIELADEG